jgi:hypothetical protein
LTALSLFCPPLVLPSQAKNLCRNKKVSAILTPDIDAGGRADSHLSSDRDSTALAFIKLTLVIKASFLLVFCSWELGLRLVVVRISGTDDFDSHRNDGCASGSYQEWQAQEVSNCFVVCFLSGWCLKLGERRDETNQSDCVTDVDVI